MSFLENINLIKNLNIRTKLTLWFVLFFGAASSVFALITLYNINRTLRVEFDTALFNYAVDIGDSIILTKKGLTVEDDSLDNEKILPFLLGNTEIQIRDINGKILKSQGLNLENNFFESHIQSDIEELAKGKEHVFHTLSKDLNNAETNIRIVSYPIKNKFHKIQYIVSVSAPMTLIENQIKNWNQLLMLGIPLVLLVGTLGGFFLSTKALLPIRLLIKKTENITATDLSERLPEITTNDEFKLLTNTLNAMLDRLEKAFKSQERFVADASHQLFTPISLLITELEIIKKNPQNITGDNLESLLSEARQLSRVVQDMLLIAKIDAGLDTIEMNDVYLDEVIFDVLKRTQKIANSKHIKLKFDLMNPNTKRYPIKADYDLMLSLIFNLVENAIKYSSPNEQVEINLDWGTDTVTLRIIDFGLGISEEQFEHIFQRFSRGPDAEKLAKGYGLGLSIANKISKLHGGKLNVLKNEPKGSIFELQIKKN